MQISTRQKWRVFLLVQPFVESVPWRSTGSLGCRESGVLVEGSGLKLSEVVEVEGSLKKSVTYSNARFLKNYFLKSGMLEASWQYSFDLYASQISTDLEKAPRFLLRFKTSQCKLNNETNGCLNE